MLAYAGIVLASSLVMADTGVTSSPMPLQISQELDYFVGDWRLEGEGARGPMKSSWSMRWAPGQHCLIVEYSRREPENNVFGSALWGWDSATGEIVYHALFADRGLEHIRSKIEKPGVFRGTYTGSLQGKKVNAVCELRKEGPDQWTFKTTGVAASGLGELDVRFKRVTAAPSGIPKNALTEMGYRVGKWESIGFIDGVEQSKPSAEVTRWVAGKYAIQIAASFVENGVDIDASGIVGWDADKQQLVEHWYNSEGGYASFRYFLGKKKDAWVGTFTWVYANGKRFEGDSIVLKKGKDEWEWKASYLDDGKKHTWRTINRRVK